LSNELTINLKDDEKVKDEDKHVFYVGMSLERVGVHTILHFVHNFPYHILNLNLDMKASKWKNLIDNSILFKVNLEPIKTENTEKEEEKKV
jgi:pyrroloquinoline quinone (PQQ) biosynthesis protein C